MGGSSSKPHATDAVLPPPKQSAHRRSLSRNSANSEKSTASGKFNVASGSGSFRSSSLKKAKDAIVGVLGAEANSRAKRHRLEAEIAKIIKAKAQEEGRPRKMSFSRLILKIPTTLAKGFKKCRLVFADLDTDGTGLFNLEQCKVAARRLGYSPTSKELQRIFEATDLDGSHSLDSKEMVIVIAILHLMKGPDDEEDIDSDILAAFQCAEEAFLSFDSSSNGYISKEEMDDMMTEAHTKDLPHSPAADMAGDPLGRLVSRRFEELDVSGDGKISFIEFLFTLEEWASIADDDSEEE